uniref:UDP-glucuronosyltransferase 3A1-like n=1 Tax=Diabrotica virgifera virgifera TaxID=50390 RepID=A0A6P7F682_DIAVI
MSDGRSVRKTVTFSIPHMSHQMVLGLLERTMFLLFLLLDSFSFIQCVKILGIFPTPSYSHQIVFQPIWKELSLRGHNVTVVTPHPLNDSSLTNLTEIDVSFVYDIVPKYGWPKEYLKLPSTLHKLDYFLNAGNDFTMEIFEYGPVQRIIDQRDAFDLLIVQLSHNMNLLLYGLAFNLHIPILVNECLNNTSQASQARLSNSCALRKTIRRKRNEIQAAPPNPVNLEELRIPEHYRIYEVSDGVKENFLLADNGKGSNRILIFRRDSWLQHLQTSPIWFADGTFSIAPPLFSQVFTVKATKNNGVHPIFYALLPNKSRATYSRMFDLIKNLKPNLSPTAIHCDFEQAAFAAMEDCFPGVNINGCFFHLAQNMKKHVAQLGHLTEYNNDAQFALNFKMVTSLAFVPVRHLDQAIDVLENALPVDIQEYLDSALQGVVYFSLGSNVKSANLTEQIRKEIVAALGELPYNVLWKWETDYLPDKPDNVMTKKWCPQQDILAHPNIKVFVMQGGLQSIEEAITLEVPFVGIPLITDQHANVKRIVELGLGVKVDYKTLTKDILQNAIMEVAQNPTYKEEVRKAKSILLDEPMKGVEKAVWWIEYVIRHKGAKHLRSPAADMSFCEYFMVDVVLFLLTCITVVLYSAYKLLTVLRSMLRSLKKIKKQ